MKKRKSIFLTLFGLSMFVSTFSAAFGQETQTIRGTIVDKETQSSLPGATIVILNTVPLLGTTSDATGTFRIDHVPVGRYNIQFSFLGYESYVMSEVIVGSGKQVLLNIGLKEVITFMNTVEVKADINKDKALNTMATVSARSFTVEETRRYAGGLDDPARMVSAFAGVTVGNIQDNAISIRGNSPKGVSWRLEGVEIPNPNHFAGGNVAGGGAVTIFSSQLLANSDFFTGAFPAEYGNALAGVFDMKLRNGNNERREHTFQAGLLGVDVASEGPFVKGKKATYLFNYRYSTFGILNKMGVIPSSQIPEYQDISFKLNFPTQRAGVFSLWGIGGKDINIEPDAIDSSEWETDWDRIGYVWHLDMGAAGLSHKMIIGKKSYVNSTLAFSGTQNKMNATRIDDQLNTRKNWDFVDNSSRVTLSTTLNHKFNPRHTLKTGMNVHALLYHLNLNSTIQDDPETFQNFVKENGQSSFTEVFAQSKYDLTENISIFTGLNANYFALNNDISVDPRLSLTWSFLPNQTISLGYGTHSQLEELKIYLINREVEGVKEYPNKNLKMSKAQHLVFSYDLLMNEYMRLKIEPYYQHLYGIPGIADSSYSMINFSQDWSFREPLKNNSTGQNVGIDVTLERFLHKNYYYLITASVFDSRYKGDDGVWRNTRYNKGYVSSVLFGKEFNIHQNKVLGINGRLTVMGGERTSPILTERSIQQKTIIYDDSRAFEKQLPMTKNLDISVTYRINKRKYAGIWALQVKNMLGEPMQEGPSYNYRTQQIENGKVVVILPVVSYKIEF